MKKMLFLLPAVLLLLTSCAGKQPEIKPEASQGSINLSGFDFTTSGSVPLAGEWEFYPGQLLEPGRDRFSKPLYLHAPASWSTLTVDGKPFSSQNKATYRLKMTGLPTKTNLALNVPNHLTAWKLYIDGSLAAESGSVDPDNFSPRYMQIYAPFRSSGTTELVLQVANYAHREGGMCRAIEIGSARSVYRSIFSRLTINIFLASSMFCMGLYHLFLFHFRRQNKAAFYFGIACLIGTIRIMVTNYSLETLTELVPWSMLTKVEYLTLAFGISVFIMFISHVFPHESYRKISLTFLGLASVYGLFVLATPPLLFTRTLVFYQIVIVLGTIYIISIISRSVLKRREGSIIFLTSSLVMAVAIINDILYVRFIINTGHVGAFGFFVFYFGQSIMLSMMFSKAFNRSESLSRELLGTNQAYSRFVPAQFLEYLDKTSIMDINLGDQTQRDMTILFADIRSFTTLSEKMPPQDNFNFINSYLKRMGPIIRRNGGFIDKYIGDGIMALFPGRPDDAIQAVIEMKQELAIYNTHRKRCGYRPIKVGYGLHTGKLMLGVIGESERMESTVISDAVNIAARIESLTKECECDVLLSDNTLQAIVDRAQFSFTRIGKVRVKGKRSQLLVHSLVV